ncbi:MAG: nucleotide exchange factor GrpE [Longimicrobiales bacterium]
MPQASPDDDDVPGTAAEPQLEDLQRELSTLNDRHLRLAAEFDNYRKRTERERADLYARAQGELVRRLLDGLDDLERVADHAETSSAKLLLEGVQLVEKKMLHSLAAAGLEMVDPAGEPFDPASMEAVGVVITDDPDADGLVADVFQKGYRFAGSLIRPARVRVYQYGD